MHDISPHLPLFWTTSENNQNHNHNHYQRRRCYVFKRQVAPWRIWSLAWTCQILLTRHIFLVLPMFSGSSVVRCIFGALKDSSDLMPQILPITEQIFCLSSMQFCLRFLLHSILKGGSSYCLQKFWRLIARRPRIFRNMARVLVQKNVASAILLGDAPAENAEWQLQPGHSKIFDICPAIWYRKG